MKSPKFERGFGVYLIVAGILLIAFIIMANQLPSENTGNFFPKDANAQNDKGRLISIKEFRVAESLWNEKVWFTENLDRKYHIGEEGEFKVVKDNTCFVGKGAWFRIGSHANYFLDKLDKKVVEFVLNSHLRSLGFFAEYNSETKTLVISKIER